MVRPILPRWLSIRESRIENRHQWLTSQLGRRAG
jgi:hypothetical protein